MAFCQILCVHYIFVLYHYKLFSSHPMGYKYNNFNNLQGWSLKPIYLDERTKDWDWEREQAQEQKWEQGGAWVRVESRSTIARPRGEWEWESERKRYRAWDPKGERKWFHAKVEHEIESEREQSFALWSEGEIRWFPSWDAKERRRDSWLRCKGREKRCFPFVLIPTGSLFFVFIHLFFLFR